MPFTRKNLYLENVYHLWLACTRELQTLWSMPRGGARGQNLGYVQIDLFSFIESVIFEKLFRPEFFIC